jgi:hypothetical protein
VATADVVAAATNATAEASHVFAATHAADMGTTAEASDVTSAAKTAAHMAAATEAATEAAAVTATAATAAATTAGIGGARQQARSEKRSCQYRDHPFHHDSPFQSDCFGAVACELQGATRTTGRTTDR